MGEMMHGKHMQAMQALMPWMNGFDIKVAPTEAVPKFDADLRARGKPLF